LFNEIAERLGENSVFMDVDSIPLGRDFRSILQEVLASCDLMLVLIGRNWVDVKDEEGRTRLGNPGDFVRLEIEAALKRDIVVTPVLVQGAHMPAAEELPSEIKDLAYRNGFELSHSRWESDVREMIRRLGLDGPVQARQIDSMMRAGNPPLPKDATVPPDRCRPTDSAGYPITTAIVAAVSAIRSDLVKSSVKVAYDGLKAAIRRKFGEASALSMAIEDLEANPMSKGQALVLEEKVANAKAAEDADVVQALSNLVTVLKEANIGDEAVRSINVHISGGAVQGVVGAQEVAVGSMTFGAPSDKRS
jgi:hypothetical protein